MINRHSQDLVFYGKAHHQDVQATAMRIIWTKNKLVFDSNILLTLKKYILIEIKQFNINTFSICINN